MKMKTLLLLGALIAAGSVMAGPPRGRSGGGPRGGGGFRPPPRAMHGGMSFRHHSPPPLRFHAPLHRHVSYYNRGGSGFWTGFAGGVVGGIIGGTLTDAVVGPSVIVTSPSSCRTVRRSESSVQDTTRRGPYRFSDVPRLNG